MLRSPKNIVIAVVLVLVVIVAIQNKETVDTKILFATISMPRSLLLFVMLAIGIVTGLLLSARSKKKQRDA